MPKDPYQYFRIEAKDLVEQLSRGVLDLEQGVSGKDFVGRMLRLAHTLKGAAHVVKQAEIAKLAHQLEDVLVPHAAGDAVAKREAESMLRLVDGIAARLAMLGSEQIKPESTTGEPAAQPSASVPAPADEAFDTIHVDLGDMDALLEGIAEAGVQLSGLKTKLAGIKDAAELSALVLNQLQSRTTFEQGNGRAAAVGKACDID